MRIPSLIVVLFVLVSLTAPAAAQTEPSALDNVVSVERQKSLGLGTLSKVQRDAIAMLMVEAYEDEVDAGVEYALSVLDSAPPPRTSGSTTTVIESTIDGEFEGWEGETIVKLTNGQIWQQAEYYYTYHYAYRPDVLIYKSGTSYKMKVDGVDRAVQVSQLR